MSHFSPLLTGFSSLLSYRMTEIFFSPTFCLNIFFFNLVFSNSLFQSFSFLYQILLLMIIFYSLIHFFDTLVIFPYALYLSLYIFQMSTFVFFLIDLSYFSRSLLTVYLCHWKFFFFAWFYSLCCSCIQHDIGENFKLQLLPQPK